VRTGSLAEDVLVGDQGQSIHHQRTQPGSLSATAWSDDGGSRRSKGRRARVLDPERCWRTTRSLRAFEWFGARMSSAAKGAAVVTGVTRSGRGIGWHWPPTVAMSSSLESPASAMQGDVKRRGRGWSSGTRQVMCGARRLEHSRSSVDAFGRSTCGSTIQRVDPGAGARDAG